MTSLLDQIFNRNPDNATATVELYTWQLCPFCLRAKFLLWTKGVDYTEYKIDGDEAARQQMSERAGGRRSVPQIFIDDRHIGGFDDMEALDRQGGLDPLLQRQTA